MDLMKIAVGSVLTIYMSPVSWRYGVPHGFGLNISPDTSVKEYNDWWPFKKSLENIISQEK